MSTFARSASTRSSMAPFNWPGVAFTLSTAVSTRVLMVFAAELSDCCADAN
eukprot:CAMPEP_0119336238 /NCGR_PEP_ID=MMETSP1333-20130426/91386_1 /TAXON_ID=418940 /ORGANISM="Scyphosphaera apsteinii, Strain RCC1455" /LENGTH=50 /DNA_ID=CAMNT_0007346995 /DNA_START=91 /DNA_END=240 /DNA_ORIENTATION=+